MDGTRSLEPSAPAHAAGPDLRSEVIGSLLLFVLTLALTAGVAVIAHYVVSATG